MTDTRLPPQPVRDMRRSQMIAGAFGLTDGDRYDIATVLFNREIRSWNDLDQRELHILRMGLECAVLVCKVHMERRSGERSA